MSPRGANKMHLKKNEKRKIRAIMYKKGTPMRPREKRARLGDHALHVIKSRNKSLNLKSNKRVLNGC